MSVHVCVCVFICVCVCVCYIVVITEYSNTKITIRLSPATYVLYEQMHMFMCCILLSIAGLEKIICIRTLLNHPAISYSVCVMLTLY